MCCTFVTNVFSFQIGTVRLVGMMLVAFVQTKHMAHVYDIDSEIAGTGIMGMMVCNFCYTDGCLMSFFSAA